MLVSVLKDMGMCGDVCEWLDYRLWVWVCVLLVYGVRPGVSICVLLAYTVYVYVYAYAYLYVYVRVYVFVYVHLVSFSFKTQPSRQPNYVPFI